MDDYNGLPLEGEETPDQQPEENQSRRPGADLFEWLQLFLGCVVTAVLLFNCCGGLKEPGLLCRLEWTT